MRGEKIQSKQGHIGDGVFKAHGKEQGQGLEDHDQLARFRLQLHGTPHGEADQHVTQGATQDQRDKGTLTLAAAAVAMT